MNFPTISFKARVVLGLLRFPTSGCFCIGGRERHTIFAPGIWWDMVEGEACKS